MPRIMLRITIAVFILFCFHTVTAQDVTNRNTPTATAPVITGTASAERLRFTAPNTVVQMHLQIYADSGQLLFDVTSKGNVLDWTLQDNGGEHLVPGSYLCVVTVKSLSGKLSQRIGSALVQEKQVELQRVDATLLTAAQQQAVGPIEGNGALTILKGDEGQAITVLANNGSDGQIIRDRGALSFRLGDFFSGKDKEQMRLTEEGNLGIGTDKPQAKLDVAGTIRTTKGIEFADGTVQTTGLSGRKDKDGNLEPNVAGTGTQNRLAKWTDNAGTLGDSLLGETAGGVELRPAVTGVGVNPTLTNFGNVAGFAQVSFYPAAGANTNMSFSVVPRGTGAANNRAQFSIFNTDLAASPTNYEFAAMRARGSDFVLGTGKSGTGVNRPFMFASGYLSDNTTNNGQLYLASNGNVGVGTTNPTAKLDVAGDAKVSSNLTVDTNTLFVNAASEQVGIGTTTPGSKLDVVGNINTTTQYNIGGSRVLSKGGTANLFAGVGAGESNTTGSVNSFFGQQAGGANTTGSNNSFFGQFAGGFNTTGGANSFFGQHAGAANTTGDFNSFFGQFAGAANTTGAINSFFGTSAGFANTTGDANSFFGTQAGLANTTGGENSFFGQHAGAANTTGDFNSFFGRFAGDSNMTGGGNNFVGFQAGRLNTSGGSNTFIGANSGSSNTGENNNTFIGNNANGAAGITNATAIGIFASVTQSNSLVLGSINTVNGATTDTNVGIGTTAPQSRLDVRGTPSKLIRTESSSTVGTWINLTNTAGGRSWNIISSGSANGEGASKLMFFDETAFATRMTIDENGNVVINQLGAAGNTSLCRNGLNQISTCSSSLRYKTNIKPFSNGLNFINRLRPIAFSWKDGGMKDVGFGAEDVARISPLLVTYNAKGEIEGVKYDRLSVIFVNAFKEQQLQLDRKDAEIQTLKAANASMNVRLSKVEQMMRGFKSTQARKVELPGPRRTLIKRHRAR